MDIGFFVSPRKRAEQQLGTCFKEGAERHGHRVDLIMDASRPALDVACVIGIKDANLMNYYLRRGTPVLYWDKAYNRHKGWFRLAINSNHPTEYLTKLDCPDDRRLMFGWEAPAWRRKGKHILIAGSSGKFHSMNGMISPEDDVRMIIDHLKPLTDRPIIYRPKPSYEKAHPVEGSEFDRSDNLADRLRKSWVVITRGSNACFDALMHGIPSIVLGTAIMKPISSTALSDIENPRLATDDEKRRFLNDLAYCQWKPEELVKGEAWEWISRKLTL